jgi:hypothetical protein
MNYNFTQLPDAWSDPNFTFEQRFIVARILRFEENGQKYFMKRKEFCSMHGISYRRYDYALKYLKNLGIVKVSKKTAKNIAWLTIDQDILAKYVKGSFPTMKESELLKCQNDTATVTKEHSDSDKRAPAECQNDTPIDAYCHHSNSKQATKQGNIENNIESNKQTNDSSFDDFRKEVAPVDELEEFMNNLDI